MTTLILILLAWLSSIFIALRIVHREQPFIYYPILQAPARAVAKVPRCATKKMRANREALRQSVLARRV